MTAAPKVSFLIAGVQKGGTTALFHYLYDQPSIQMAPMKEVHFFDDDDGVDWSAPDYSALDAAFPALDERLRGEATPIYLYWPPCLPRIARYNPAMKLIFLFRDPIHRAWSQWKMDLARGFETEPFAWCIREGRARVDSPQAPGFHRVYSYVERGFYARQIDRLLEVFPREQLLFLSSDALDNDLDATLGQVCAFLGVPTPQSATPQRRNESAKDIDYGQTLTDDDVAYLREIYADDLARFAMLTRLPVSHWLTEEPR